MQSAILHLTSDEFCCIIPTALVHKLGDGIQGPEGIGTVEERLKKIAFLGKLIQIRNSPKIETSQNKRGKPLTS